MIHVDYGPGAIYRGRDKGDGARALRDLVHWRRIVHEKRGKSTHVVYKRGKGKREKQEEEEGTERERERELRECGTFYVIFFFTFIIFILLRTGR